MTKRVTGILALAALLSTTPIFADVHTVFTASVSWFGRERSARAESWIGADREWVQTAAETRIARKDLGLMWRMKRSGEKKYNEYPLEPETPTSPGPKPSPRRRGGPDPAADPNDLRFVGGHFDDPVYEWQIQALADEPVRGELCKVFSIRGDADFASVNIKIWIVPDGKSQGLAVPDDLFPMAFARSAVAAEAVIKIMADYPKGGLIRMERTEDPQIGPLGRSKIELETYEAAAPPAGIYDLPAGYVKE